MQVLDAADVPQNPCSDMWSVCARAVDAIMPTVTAPASHTVLRKIRADLRMFRINPSS
jgi:hypothetical protein